LGSGCGHNPLCQKAPDLTLTKKGDNMIEGGFFLSARKLYTGWISTLPPATRLVVMHSIFKANWDDVPMVIMGVRVVVPRGSFITSLRSMASEVNVSTKPVRIAFRVMEQTKMATVSPAADLADPTYDLAPLRSHVRSQHGLHVILLNYNKYQDMSEYVRSQPEGVTPSKSGHKKKEEEKIERKEEEKRTPTLDLEKDLFGKEQPTLRQVAICQTLFPEIKDSRSMASQIVNIVGPNGDFDWAAELTRCRKHHEEKNPKARYHPWSTHAPNWAKGWKKGNETVKANIITAEDLK